MRYGVEYVNGKLIEILEIEGHVAVKTWERKDGQLITNDEEFSDQFN